MANPAPKHPSERRNRIPPARGEWIDIPAPSLDEPCLPELTKLQKGHFNRIAKENYRVWRFEPVCAYWSKVDIKAAMNILELYNVDDWTRNAAEIRQRETALGLNPKGKRDLRFRITFGPGKEATKHEKIPAIGDDNVVDMDARRQSLGHGA